MLKLMFLGVALLMINACVHGDLLKTKDLTPDEKKVKVFKSEKAMKKKCGKDVETFGNRVEISGTEFYVMPWLHWPQEDGSLDDSINLAKRSTADKGANAFYIMKDHGVNFGKHSITYQSVKCNKM